MKIYYESLRGGHIDSKYPGYGEYCDPSRYWGERLDIPELFNSYEKVLGDRHAEYQNRIRTIRNGDIDFRDTLYDELVKEYPELLTISLVNSASKYHVVYGCISKFNVHDIHYFVTVPMELRGASHMARRDTLQAAVGYYHLEWVLSDYTMTLMEQKLIKKAA